MSNDIKASENASSTTNVPINNIIQSNKNYVNNLLPTAEQLNQPSQEIISYQNVVGNYNYLFTRGLLYYDRSSQIFYIKNRHPNECL